MIDTSCLRIDTSQWQNEDQTRIRVLELLLAGYSNNCIAKEMNFSLKNIESIISKLFRRSNIITRGGNSNLLNPRVKLLVNGLEKQWLQYQAEDTPIKLDFLTRNQYFSLALCASGCSNKAIAEFLCISAKTVESRLNSLFHQFAVDMQQDRQINPRIKLIVNALTRRVITSDAIIAGSHLLDFDNWQEAVNRREDIKNELLRLQIDTNKHVDTSYVRNDINLENALNRLLAYQKQILEQKQQTPTNMPQNTPLFQNPMQYPMLPIDRLKH